VESYLPPRDIDSLICHCCVARKFRWPVTLESVGRVGYCNCIDECGQSQWPRGLRRVPAAARLLVTRGLNPAWASIFVSCGCCGLSGRVFWDELIPHPEESCRRWYVWVWSWSLDNEEALAHWGLLQQEGGGRTRQAIGNDKQRDLRLVPLNYRVIIPDSIQWSLAKLIIQYPARKLVDFHRIR